MGLASFLSSLLERGRVQAPVPNELSEDELRAGDAVLLDFEAQYRKVLPGTPPRLDRAAARWGAVQFLRGCQFTVYRDVPAELIEQELAPSCPLPTTPAVHYSVDLVFRFLPDLVRFARSAAEGDPLVNHLMHWARDWPLSSVGIVGVDAVDVNGFVADSALLALYVDRILEAGDLGRLTDERVRDAARTALGLHPELAPEVAAALDRPVEGRKKQHPQMNADERG
jgi:MoxR-vWA-beta-propeller ternary system domain bpX4